MLWNTCSLSRRILFISLPPMYDPRLSCLMVDVRIQVVYEGGVFKPNMLNIDPDIRQGYAQ